MNVADFDDVDPFDTDDDLPDERDQGSAEGPTDPLFGGVDVTALAGELVGPAVRRSGGPSPPRSRTSLLRQ